MITFFRCGQPGDPDDDATSMEFEWGAYLGAIQQAAQDEAIRCEDEATRMAGRCDRCQEWPGEVLTMSGGEALCDDCVAEDVADVA